MAMVYNNLVKVGSKVDRIEFWVFEGRIEEDVYMFFEDGSKVSYACDHIIDLENGHYEGVIEDGEQVFTRIEEEEEKNLKRFGLKSTNLVELISQEVEKIKK